MSAKRKSASPRSSPKPNKRSTSPPPPSSSAKKSKIMELYGGDSDLGSDSDNDNDSDSDKLRRSGSNDQSEDSDSDPERTRNETVQETRARLSRKYLSMVESRTKGDNSDCVSDSDSDDNENDNEMHQSSSGASSSLAATIQKERLKARGQYEALYADKISARLKSMNKVRRSSSEADPNLKLYRGHNLPCTSCCLTADGVTAYSGGKNNEIIQWDVEYEKKVRTIVKAYSGGDASVSRNDGEVLCLDVSGLKGTGTYLAAGRRDGKVAIFDVRQSGKGVTEGAALPPPMAPIQVFGGHKAAVPSLSFRKNSPTHQLFTASIDRCIRHYSLDSMSYVETLYGHQGPINSIDCLNSEQPISCR